MFLGQLIEQLSLELQCILKIDLIHRYQFLDLCLIQRQRAFILTLNIIFIQS
jgi:hypothetical protein